MFRKSFLLLALIATLVACNPPSNVQLSSQCSNSLTLTYTATNDGNLDDYAALVYRMVGTQPDPSHDIPVGGAGVPIPGTPFSSVMMPSTPNEQTYTITIPIMGPNYEFQNDPWPTGTKFYAMIFYGGVAPNILYLTTPTITCSAGSAWNPDDTRINRDPGALAVIYPHIFADGHLGLHIYRVDPQTSGGTLALVVTPDMLAAFPDFPTEYTIIARSEDGTIELTKLPTGQYQVNAGPDPEGKIHVVVFDRIETGSPYQVFTVSIYGE
jgi:hypothetical protein